MKPLNFKYQYFALVFIFLFIFIGSVNATDNLNYNDNNGDSSPLMVSADFNQTAINNPIKDDESIKSLSTTTTTKTKIYSKSLTVDYGTEGYVVGYLRTSSGKAVKGKTVKITINSQTWSKTTDSNGKVSLKIMNLTPNIYPTKFIFAGGSGYSASSYLVNVTVNKIGTKIIADDLYSYNDNILVAYLKDSKNNSLKNKLVKFTINGNSFNGFSDSEGKITFNIPSSLEAKNYSSTINFFGDKLYSSSSKSVKVYKINNLTIDSFIDELMNSKEFSKLLNNSLNSSELSLSDKSSKDIEFMEWVMNRSTDEINFIDQFLNLISSNNASNLNLSLIAHGKNPTPTLDSKDEIDNTLLEDFWVWLNTPILEIPGYGDLDKKYGVVGQGLKLAGWFLLGIDDNGGLTPLDIGLDVLSICSGAGLAEHIGLSSSSLVLKIANKFPRFNSLLKTSIKIRGLDYSITVKSLFNAYKSTLSLANNPIKFVSNKLITNLLDKSDSKLASFAIGYLSNSFITLSNVLGISEVYVNAKNNTLLARNIISNLTNIKSIKTVVNNSQSSVVSTIKNVKTTVSSVSKSIKTTTDTITKTLNYAKKVLNSTYKILSKNVKSSNIYKKVTNKLNLVKKTVNKLASSVNNTVNKAASSVSKAINSVNNAIDKVINKATSSVKKVSKSVKSKVSDTVQSAKKAASSVSKAVKKTTSTVKKTAVKTVNKVVNNVNKAASSVSKAVNNVKNTVSSLVSKLF